MYGYKEFTDLQAGEKETMVGKIESINEADTKSGSKYCIITIFDGKTSEPLKKWQQRKEDMKFKEGDAVLFGVDVQTYNDAKSYVCTGITDPPESITPDLFAKRSEFRPEEMASAISKYVHRNCPNAGPDSPVALFDAIWEQYAGEGLLQVAAGKRMHQAWIGGLLEHTLGMIMNAEVHYKVKEKFHPNFYNPEILFPAVALHDIGKVYEMKTDDLGNTKYSVYGHLLGHLAIGLMIIDREVQKNLGKYDPEKVLLLEHCIAAHHGKREFGAIEVPRIPEAMLLSELDMIDAKEDIFRNAYVNIPNGTGVYEEMLRNDPGMTEKVFGLEGNPQIYKASIRPF